MLLRNLLCASACFLFAGSVSAARAETTSVTLFVIALEDAGKSGKAVGCGDSVVGIRRGMDATSTPLQAALSVLLTLGKDVPGGEKMYNSLAASDLRVGRVEVLDGKAVVDLKGDLRLGGVCDSPRLEAQLRETILQFPEVRSAAISINGKPLEEVLSQK